ncbi:oxygenase MpaB family protein [Streptomyces pristinaespiralis]|uniref:oxygenase MpaB family protein n=1 Tax=Streptomyces pristinaespiralis TaxID=38300 RepID=UPI000A561F94|nr:oxygenase MpaB family protein [Streptomyces pristinaespiralis]
MSAVRRIHGLLKATDPDTGERFGVGEPELLLWVHVRRSAPAQRSAAAPLRAAAGRRARRPLPGEQRSAPPASWDSNPSPCPPPPVSRPPTCRRAGHAV